MSKGEIRAGVRRLFRLPMRSPRDAHADADAELDGFLEQRTDDLVRHGMTPVQARAEAERRLGASIDDVRSSLRTSAVQREERRDHQGYDGLIQDVKYGLRALLRSPTYTIVA